MVVFPSWFDIVSCRLILLLNAITPLPEGNRLPWTHNHLGTLLESPDLFTSEAALSVAPGNRVLSIGSGTGMDGTLHMFARGVKLVINEIDENHRSILRQLAVGITSEREVLDRLEFVARPFPAGLSHCRSGTFDVILASRVLHDMTPSGVMSSLREIRRLLRPPNGTAYLSVDTIHHRALPPELRDECRRRQRRGEPWPGYISDFIARIPNYPSDSPIPYRTFMEPEELAMRATEVGLRVASATYIDRRGNTLFTRYGPGRQTTNESAGVIVVVD